MILACLVFAQTAWASIDFDNTDDVLPCGSAASLDNLTTLTYTAWINADTLDGEQAIVYKNDGTDGRFFYALNGGTGALRMGIDKSILDANATSADNTITTGAWYFVATTWSDGSAPLLYTATPGVAVAEVTYSGIPTAGTGTNIDDAAGQLTIGSRVSLNPFFDGRIDEVCVYNAVLTLAQLQQIAGSQTRRMCLQVASSSLVGYWSLDDQPDGTSGDGDTFYDRSSGSNNCTGDDGAGNAGLTVRAGEVVSYP